MIDGLLKGLPPVASSLETARKPPATDEEAGKVAGEFEALLIGQILQSMSTTAGGSLWGGEDSSASSMIEFAQEHLAKSIAAGGGLGLAKVVREGLRQKSSS
jgi:Rod binding domain-containing protein